MKKHLILALVLFNFSGLSAAPDQEPAARGFYASYGHNRENFGSLLWSTLFTVGGAKAAHTLFKKAAVLRSEMISNQAALTKINEDLAKDPDNEELKLAS